MKRLLALIVAIIAGFVLLGVVAWARGMISLPFGPNHRELIAQLRDRGPVAIAGRIPFGVPRDETPFVAIDHAPPLEHALASHDGPSAARALRAGRYDGLMVRTDAPQGAPGSVLRTLSDMQPVEGLAASYLDETAAIYEAREPIAIAPDDARRLIEVVRLVLQGAVPPPENLYPEFVRRPYPTEVAIIVRDGHDPILWRAVRGGSISRAMIDATYAVLDRWNTRQQQHYGPLREAINSHPITIAIFHDRGVLGARTASFLRRAVDPRRFAIGYEYLGRWEYVLPPSPWAPMPDPVRAIQDLARDHDLPRPGYLRPEITLYRFRAYEIAEEQPQGAVTVFEPYAH